MTRKLMLTAVVILSFFSLSITADSVTSRSIFINKALAGTESAGAGNGSGR